jgi:hypothetical protein
MYRIQNGTVLPGNQTNKDKKIRTGKELVSYTEN